MSYFPFRPSRLDRPILDFASQYAAFCQQKFPSLLPGEALGNMQIFPFLFLLLSRRQSRKGVEGFFWVRLRRVGRAQAAFEMTHLSCKKLFLSSSPLFPSSLSCSSCWTLACTLRDRLFATRKSLSAPWQRSFFPLRQALANMTFI